MPVMSPRPFLLRPGRGAQYCNQTVCVYVSVREHISGTSGPIFTKFVVHISRDRGSILLWRRCDTLCTSGFVDDVTFGRNGPYGVSQHRGGIWFMNALLHDEIQD